MRISFLLGPAGSGKTFRCLAEARTELARDPAGTPLILLAPKQATFQLERQLLEPGQVGGYSRLHIFSFERLARFVFDAAGEPLPRFISEEGRTMLLRALLNRHEGDLSIFRAAARRHGFPEELARQLREFANHGLTPQGLRDLADRAPARNALPQKLRDFAFIMERYRAWLDARALQDSDAFLGAAADLLQGTAQVLRIGGLWMDGFAQLTPEERRLVVALLGCCDRAALAFCVENGGTTPSQISPWYLVSQTMSRVKTDLETRYKEATITVEALSRDSEKTRFSQAAALSTLEANWGRLGVSAESSSPDERVRLFECADPDAEVACCAREIIRFVRAGGRFREAAVLVRSFDNDYPHLLRRTLRQYQIPFFIDHRPSVAHHPLAELTRATLRTIAFDWEQGDWFVVLKTGLLHLAPDEADRIENAALKRGWQGAVWREGVKMPQDPALERDFNRWREKLLPPFVALRGALGSKPSGQLLADALRAFWRALSIQEQLENWARENPEGTLHSTVWDQMNAWLENLELAFGDQNLSLKQWIPILEAGLGSLTVGIIPPVLDEVLVGAVDRSRNPDLKLLCILGFNEQVFPAAPGHDSLLTEDDRHLLLDAGSDLAQAPALQLAAEQFYGYIACTRAREKLCISYSRAALDGSALNPSRFIAQLRRIFPTLQPVAWNYPRDAAELLHRCELPLLGIAPPTLATPDQDEKLSPEIARQLYGANLNLAVSRLERFAGCPFRFFVERGLHVRERDEFKLDVREKGSFQHAVLSEFHQRVKASQRSWRKVSTTEARELIGRIAEEQMASFHDGLLQANHEHRFTAENYKLALQEFIHAIIEWFDTNEFDPTEVEFGFGAREAVPGWTIELPSGSVTLEGRVDRLDLVISGDEAFCLIIDYKSGQQKPDRTLTYFGVQQQLTAYLLAMTNIPEIAQRFGVKAIKPAGAFLLPLRAHHDSIKTRRDAAGDADSARRSGYIHNGIFNFDQIELLDKDAPEERSGQFYYSLTSKGKPRGNSFNALKKEEFRSVLDRTEALIREFGQRIYDGDIAVRPFKKGVETACDKCQMQPICRFDPWTQNYQRLKMPSSKKVP